jgi:DNA polymerase III delta subunit
MAVENALNFLRGGARSPAPIYLIAGPQPFLRESVLEALRLRSAAEGFQYRPFQVGGSDGYSATIRELESADLFAPKRLIACRVLKTHRERAGADDDSSNDVEGRTGGGADESALGAALERIGGAVQVAMVYERDNAPAKIRRVVEKLGTVINCLRPYDNQVGQYAEVFAKNLGFKLSFDAVNLLVARHGSDLAAIHNALAKAAITNNEGSKVEVADLGSGGGSSRIPELFELAESIARGRPGEALALFDRAIETGRDAIELLALEIIPLVRRMLVAVSLLEKRRTPADVARALGMPPSSQLIVRAIDGGRRFGAQRLIRAHRHACVLDANFKNGLIREREQAISGLLLDLMAPADSVRATAAARKI